MKIIHSPRHARHATALQIPGCPLPCFEIPARAEAIVRAICEAGLGEPTEPHDFGMAPIAAVHVGEFLEYLKTAYQASRPFFEGSNPAITDTYTGRGWRHKPADFPGRIGYFSFDATAPIFEGTWEAAYWSAQCAVTAVDLVRNGERSVYALCRPPGHHAARDMHGGFCYLNNAAIAASHLRHAAGERVAILDIDYHHGNGTQEIFYSDPDVLFCSLHASPDVDYPFFWGSRQERGEAAGAERNHNWPLPHKVSEAAYLEALGEALAVIEAYKPKFLVLSVGFDCMETDPAPLAGGAFQVSTIGLAEIARRTSRLKLPTVLIQEGGYDVERLGSYVVRFLTEFERAQS